MDLPPQPTDNFLQLHRQPQDGPKQLQTGREGFGQARVRVDLLKEVGARRQGLVDGPRAQRGVAVGPVLVPQGLPLRLVDGAVQIRPLVAGMCDPRTSYRLTPCTRYRHTLPIIYCQHVNVIKFGCAVVTWQSLHLRIENNINAPGFLGKCRLDLNDLNDPVCTLSCGPSSVCLSVRATSKDTNTSSGRTSVSKRPATFR